MIPPLFIGRSEAIAQVDRLFDPSVNPSERGYLIIEGPPGVGKTALLHHLIRTRGWPVVVGIRPATGVARFMADVLAALREQYRSHDGPMTREVRDGQPLAGLLVRIADACEARPGSPPVVIAIDALDTAEKPPPGQNTLCLPDRLPRGVFIVTTGRANAPGRTNAYALMCPDRRTPVRRLTLDPDSSEARCDIQGYVLEQARRPEIRRALEAPGWVDYLRARWPGMDSRAEQFSTAVAECARGSFAYAVAVVNDLTKTADGRKSTPALLDCPPGLLDYHNDLWAAMTATASSADTVNGFAILLALLEIKLPASATAVHAALRATTAGVSVMAVKDVLQSLYPFLRASGTTSMPLYDLHHPSMRQALKPRSGGKAMPHKIPRPQPDPVSRAAALRAVFAKLSDASRAELDAALLEDSVEKLVTIGRGDAALRLLTDFGWLMKRLRRVELDLDPTGINVPVESVQRVSEDWRRIEAAKVPVDGDAGIWRDFWRRRAHVLRRGDAGWLPHRYLLQFAAEHAADSPITRQAEAWLAEGHCDWSWLRSPWRPAEIGADPCIVVLEGHNGWITGCLLLPGGRLISWSRDNTLRLWEADGTPGPVLEGHAGSVTGCMSLHGRWPLISWSVDGTLRLWHPDWIPGPVLAGHTGPVSGCQQLHDGRFVSWSVDRSLRLWEADGTPGPLLVGHTESVTGCLSVPGNRLVTWSTDASLRLWAGDGAPLSVLEGHTGPVRGCLVLPDGRLLSWSDDRTLRLWGADGTPGPVLEGHIERVIGALPLADGRVMSWSRTLRVWNADGTPGPVLRGHTKQVNGVMELPNGWLVSWSDDETIRFWRADGTAGAVHEGHTDAVLGWLPLPDGRMLSWSRDRTLRVWRADGAGTLVLEGHTDWVTGCLLSSDDKLVSWSDDRTLRLWRLDHKPDALPEGHNGAVTGSLLLPDGGLVTWSRDRTLRRWAPAGEPGPVFKGHSGWVSGCVTLPDDDLMSFSADRTLRRWKPDGTLVQVLAEHEDLVRGCLVLPDGRLVSWSKDGRLHLWEADGTPGPVLVGHTDGVNGCLSLPAGSLVSWGEDGTLRWWEPDGLLTRVVEANEGPVLGCTWLRNGRLVSWSGDGSLSVRRAEDGLLLKTLEGHSGPVRGCLETFAGELVSWSDDATVRRWEHDGPCRTIFSGAVTTVWPDRPDRLVVVTQGFGLHGVALNGGEAETLAWASLSDAEIIPDGQDGSGLPWLRPNTTGWPAAIRLECWHGGKALSSLSFG